MAQTKSKTLTLELINQRPSGFVLEGTSGDDAVRISAPNKCFIPVESVIKVDQPDGGYSYEKIRHIEGCPYLLVSDQVKHNWKPNPSNDQIVFENGVLLVANEGRDRSRFAYLLACEFNGNNKDRPESAEPIFRVIEKEKEAEKFLHSVTDKLEAMAILSSLSDKMEEGFSYNEEKIDYMCSLHGLHGYEGYAEKLQSLMYIADANPKQFIESVANARASYKVDIALAEKYSVISLAGEHASFNEGGLKFFKFTQKQAAKRQEELIDYFLTRGDEHYKQMKVALEAKKTAELALV